MECLLPCTAYKQITEWLERINTALRDKVDLSTVWPSSLGGAYAPQLTLVGWPTGESKKDNCTLAGIMVMFTVYQPTRMSQVYCVCY